MSEVIEANPDRGPIWKRGLFMLMFSVLYGVAAVSYTHLTLPTNREV